jgi:hypothetical protein
LVPPLAPLFCDDEAAIDKAFGEVEVAAVATILGHGIEHAVEDPGPDPGLIAPVAGLVGRVASRQILPGRAGLEDPEDPIEDIAGVAPGPAAPIGTPTRLGE